MTIALGSLAVHIDWIIAKPAIPGWEDIRQSTSGHTFYYIHSGKGVFYCEGEEYEVEGNTFVYLWPGLKLYMKSSEALPLRMTMLFFDCASLIKSEHGWEPPQTIERLNLPFLTPLQQDQAGVISSKFQQLEREWVPGDHVQEVKTKSEWYRLIAELQEIINDRKVRSNEKGIAEVVRWFKSMLDEHFASDTKITKLAQQSGFSPVYLRRCFSARYGCSPKEYLENLRNEHALLRLKHTGDPISQIAIDCGHSDVYQFSKMFKKRNGISPTEYRKLAK
ncbi:hypothetical protein J40TS1_12550 [Paenibacillus montaniterrae]|uniref:HTH araC/xylS-type domain-containing protein n=1 Tax=Paenibacillus montaniterrae TaxID=429341 RepID=A0A919YKK9_9BACL|nr:AraC family transcriptional regulator [Paenibacillus montaniterrae]GIP15613.1 hypothetical protein J40TS1_12550 [Paenibacillus montaniterrae]